MMMIIKELLNTTMVFGISYAKELKQAGTERLLIDYGMFLKKFGFISINNLDLQNRKRKISLLKI